MQTPQAKNRSAKGRFKRPLKTLSTHPTSKARSNLIWRQALARPKCEPEHRRLVVTATQTRKGNDEKNAFKHGVGSCGPVCMGTDAAGTATTAAATATTAAVADKYYHDNEN